MESINNYLNLALCVTLMLNWFFSALTKINATTSVINQVLIILIITVGILTSINQENPAIDTATAFIKTLILIGFIKYIQNISEYSVEKLLYKLNLVVALSGVVSGIELISKKNLLLMNIGSSKLTEMGRYSGLFSWQNIATICHSISLLWILSRITTMKKRQIYALATCNIVGVISSASLSGVFGLTTALIYLTLKNKIRKKYIYSSAVLFSIFTATTSSVIFTRLKEALGSDLSNSELQISNNSLEWRIIQWRLVLIKIKDHWIFGYGLGSSNGVADFNGYLSHNTYLTLLLEFGIVGFSLIFAITFVTSRSFLKKMPFNQTVFAKSIFICVGISGLGENLPYQIALYILVPISAYSTCQLGSKGAEGKVLHG